MTGKIVFEWQLKLELNIIGIIAFKNTTTNKLDIYNHYYDTF